ncbi:MAG: hypothetical protein R3C11_29205 [Planctomycetaceae bacterium]
MDIFSTWPTWSFIGILLLMMFLANETGFRTGRRPDQQESDSSRTVSNSFKASIFGLVAFLLAFSFSITAARHTLRRDVVLDEANAIGTCWLRAGLLNEPYTTDIRATLRRYVNLRLQYFEVAANPQKSTDTVKQMGIELDQLWNEVEEAVRADSSIARTSLIISSANDVIDLHSKRARAAASHLEPIILMLLFVSVLVSSLLFGHSSGQTNRRHTGLWLAVNVLFSLVLYAVLDFDRPRQGLVQVDHTPLIELQASINPEQKPD